jgi:hypothetical protein
MLEQATENGMTANWIGIAGLVLGVAGLLFAFYQHRQRIKMESVVRDTLQRLAGDMRVIFSNANWANQHLRRVGHLFIEPSPVLNAIEKETFDAARDAAACARQLSLMHSRIRGIQKTLFNDSTETLPEIPSDDVKAAQLMLQPVDKKPENKTVLAS